MVYGGEQKTYFKVVLIRVHTGEYCIIKGPEEEKYLAEILQNDYNSMRYDKMIQLLHIFIRRDLSVSHIGKPLLPARRKLRIQQRLDGMLHHVEDHFPQQCRRHDLGLLIQGKVFDVK